MNQFKKFSFRTASSTTSQIAEKNEALQSDFTRILDEGGFSAFRANLQFQMEAGALIRQVVIDQFSEWDATGLFVERRSARLGDRVEFTQVHNALRVVKYAPNSHPKIFTPKTSKYTVTTTMFEMAVGVSLYKLAQRQLTMADVTGAQARTLASFYNQAVLQAIDAACGPASTDFNGRPLRTDASAGLTKEALDAALRRMGSVGGDTVIFGTRYALDPIYEFGAASTDGQAEEFQNRGVVGRYRGARMVAIEPAAYDAYAMAFGPQVNGRKLDDLLFIGSGKAGATLLERDLSAMNWEDTNVERQEFRTGIRFDMGIFVHSPHLYHVIQLAA
jgi:hypothetical protein